MGRRRRRSTSPARSTPAPGCTSRSTSAPGAPSASPSRASRGPTPSCPGSSWAGPAHRPRWRRSRTCRDNEEMGLFPAPAMPACPDANAERAREREAAVRASQQATVATRRRPDDAAKALTDGSMWPSQRPCLGLHIDETVLDEYSAERLRRPRAHVLPSMEASTTSRAPHLLIGQPFAARCRDQESTTATQRASCLQQHRSDGVVEDVLHDLSEYYCVDAC